MDKEQILSILRQNEAELRKHGILHAALFGSVARGEQHADSDVDILIELMPDERRTFFGYVGITLEVEKLFPISVDVVDKYHLKPRISASVEKDALYAF